MICIWYFSICLSLLVSLEWLANQTHHTASPVNFRVFVPAYVYYEMLLYILMEYLYPSHITAWRSLNCPIHQCQTIGMYILKSQLNLCFLFLQFDLPAHIYSFSFTKLQNYKKQYENLHFAIMLHKKTHTLCFKMQQIKTFFFFFFWASLHAIFSSAFWLPCTFSRLKPPRKSLLDNCARRGPQATTT